MTAAAIGPLVLVVFIGLQLLPGGVDGPLPAPRTGHLLLAAAEEPVSPDVPAEGVTQSAESPPSDARGEEAQSAAQAQGRADGAGLPPPAAAATEPVPADATSAEAGGEAGLGQAEPPLETFELPPLIDPGTGEVEAPAPSRGVEALDLFAEQPPPLPRTGGDAAPGAAVQGPVSGSGMATGEQGTREALPPRVAPWPDVPMPPEPAVGGETAPVPGALAPPTPAEPLPPESRAEGGGTSVAPRAAPGVFELPPLVDRETRWQAARRAFWEGRFTDSERAYQALLRDEPGNWAARGELGNVYFRQGEWDAAIQTYHETALLLWSAGRLDAARYLARIVANLDPDRGQVLTRRLSSGEGLSGGR
jgi:hypothetical protein